MRREQAYRAFFISALTFALASPAQADPAFLGTQLHVRTGMLQGTYRGASSLVSGSIQVMTSLDFDVEAFSTPSQSFFLRGNLTHDLSTNRMPYAYIGTGTRYYFGRAGFPLDRTDQTSRVALMPKSRFFVGGDLGVSQVVTRVFNEALSSQATMLDFGAHAGWIYQMGHKVGLEVLGGYSMGMGFSTVSANGTILRAMVGFSYLF